MPFNVLLLPLLGGYVFITYWNYTRFNARRYSGERLLFHAALAGVSFLAMAYGITSIAKANLPEVLASWRRYVPFEYAGTSLLALLLGAVAWFPLNWFFKKERAIQAAISEWNDYLEVLLDRAMRETKQVSATLKGGKVYIGFITANMDPSFDRRFLTDPANAERLPC